MFEEPDKDEQQKIAKISEINKKLKEIRTAILDKSKTQKTLSLDILKVKEEMMGIKDDKDTNAWKSQEIELISLEKLFLEQRIQYAIDGLERELVHIKDINSVENHQLRDIKNSLTQLRRSSVYLGAGGLTEAAAMTREQLVKSQNKFEEILKSVPTLTTKLTDLIAKTEQSEQEFKKFKEEREKESKKTQTTLAFSHPEKSPQEKILDQIMGYIEPPSSLLKVKKTEADTKNEESYHALKEDIRVAISKDFDRGEIGLSKEEVNQYINKFRAIIPSVRGKKEELTDYYEREKGEEGLPGYYTRVKSIVSAPKEAFEKKQEQARKLKSEIEKAISLFKNELKNPSPTSEIRAMNGHLESLEKLQDEIKGLDNFIENRPFLVENVKKILEYEKKLKTIKVSASGLIPDLDESKKGYSGEREMGKFRGIIKEKEKLKNDILNYRAELIGREKSEKSSEEKKFLKESIHRCQDLMEAVDGGAPKPFWKMDKASVVENISNELKALKQLGGHSGQNLQIKEQVLNEIILFLATINKQNKNLDNGEFTKKLQKLKGTVESINTTVGNQDPKKQRAQWLALKKAGVEIGEIERAFSKPKASFKERVKGVFKPKPKFQ